MLRNMFIDKQVSTHSGSCVEQRNGVPHVAVACIKFLIFIKTAPFSCLNKVLRLKYCCFS